MNLYEVLKETLSSLRASKMRTFLTMLGIIIGITSVITMWSIGNGGRENIIGDLQKLGYGKFIVTIDKNSTNYKPKYFFKKDLLKEIKKETNVKEVDVDYNELRYVRVQTKPENNSNGVVAPTTEVTYNMSGIKIVEGRKFLDFEYDNKSNVIIIDNVSARAFYGSEKNAIGKYIDVFIKNQKMSIPFKIVGVYKSPAEVLMKVFGQNELFCMAPMPYGSYISYFNNNVDSFYGISVEIKEGKVLADEMKRMVEYLENKFGVKGIFNVSLASKDIDSFDKLLKTLSLFITLAAGISLFVGGIGVMNIMLVTVVERTKEIGIRKAIGATNKDILLQFLYEAVIITGIGGFIGVILGIIFSKLIGKVVSIPPSFSVESIILAFGISTLIGIIFGVSPARKAARLNPIDALRSE